MLQVDTYIKSLSLIFIYTCCYFFYFTTNLLWGFLCSNPVDVLGVKTNYVVRFLSIRCPFGVLFCSFCSSFWYADSGVAVWFWMYCGDSICFGAALRVTNSRLVFVLVNNLYLFVISVLFQGCEPRRETFRGAFFGSGIEVLVVVCCPCPVCVGIELGILLSSLLVVWVDLFWTKCVWAMECVCVSRPALLGC